MKIYIACGLTHVPRSEFNEYVSFINELAVRLNAESATSVRYALRDSDPQLAEKPFSERARLCYLWDREMVEWSDVVIAEASFPSIGLGIELQIAEAKDIPIIIAFKQSLDHKAAPVAYRTPEGKTHSLQLGEGYVSLMALGMPSVFKTIPYHDVCDAYQKLAEAVGLLGRGTGKGET